MGREGLILSLDYAILENIEVIYIFVRNAFLRKFATPVLKVNSFG